MIPAPLVADPATFSPERVLALTMWGEARGEGRDFEMELRAFLGVGFTVLNRLERGGWFGKNIKEICLKPYQYSCWNPSDPNREKMLAVGMDDPDYALCYALACRLIRGTIKINPVGKASHYHDIRLADKPTWANPPAMPLVKIDHHLFYTGVA